MSPVEYVQKEYIRHEEEQGYPVVPPFLAPEFRGEDKSQFIRKIPASFSWDVNEISN
jgi:hypothetical protein